MNGRRLLVLTALAGLLAVTQLGGALGAYPGTDGVIAYTCGTNLCTIPSSGGTATQFTGATNPSWAQGGAIIAYLTTNGIDVASYANGQITNPQLAVGTAGATDLSLSPDGTMLAYVLGGHLFTSNANGTSAVQQNAASGLVADPTWAPDGSLVAYAESQTGVSAGPYQLCVLDVFTSGAQPLCQTPPTGASDRHPNWSPGESSIVFDSTVGVGSPQLTTVNFGFGGYSSRTTLGSGITGTDPAYSPDGTSIVYVNGSGNLSTIPAGGGTQSPISGATGATTPDWQPLPFSSGGGGGGGGSGGSGPPVNTSYPTVVLPFGATQPLVGQTLFSTVGSWSGATPMTFTYQWKRCNPPGNFGSCFDIPKATSSFYTLTTDDYGDSIRIQVTASNASGTASQNSEATAAVSEIPPRARVTPPIIGQNVEGQTLSVGTGTWDGTALTFTYSWRRCDPFGNFDTCVAIPGATSNTYVQTSDDIGHALRVWITGTNLAGSDFTITNHTYPTIPKPHFAPSSTTAPQLAGLASVGDPLTATVGTWGGDLPITYAYAWQRCDATGAACRTILGATAHKYTVTRRDIGYTIRVLVTATNAYGKSSAMSDPSDTITVPPKHHRGRRIVGTRGNDYLVGGPYDDVIYGLGGNDTIHGGAGYDTIYGGAGNDVLDGGPGRDHIYGGPGSDTILAADNEPDVIDCGPGNDKATVDAFDVTKNCEDVVVAGSTASPSP